MVFGSSDPKLSVCSARFRWQIIATMTVHIMTLTHGVTVGWLAPSLPVLGSDSTPLNKPITIVEASWVGSLIGLGSVTGNLLFGFLLDRLGRKMCMYLLAIPNMAFWILVYTALNVNFIYVARFLAGIAGGGCYVVVPIFIAEISDNNIRGALSSMAMLYVSIGTIIGYVLSTYLGYYLMPCIVIALPVLFICAIMGLSETPQYLLRKGQDALAEKAYYFYKNLPISADDKESDQLDAAKKEFEAFKEEVLSGGVKQKVCWRDFFNLPTLKAFGLNITLLITNQLSGSFALFNYTSQIFNELGTKMEPNICTIIVGVTQFVGILVTISLVDRLGRRLMLLVSLVGMGLGELCIGLLKDLATDEFLANYNWLPLFLMCWVVFVGSLGVISLIFVIVIEQLPAKIRSIGTSLCLAMMSLFIFVSLKIYPLMIYGWGLANTMYMAGSTCAIGFIILGLFLPETKGKALTK